MKLLKIYPSSINSRHIDEAVAILRAGGVIIYPTDTIYAIGCDALNNNAIQRVCDIKGIDTRRESLAVACADLSQASEYARIDNSAYRLVKDCLPGPYTFILPASTRLPKLFKGRHEVGIRVPANPIAKALAVELGHPLLTTSITVDPDAPSESIEPESIALRYGNDSRIDLMIDGGDGSVEGSTVVNITDPADPVVVRQGAGPWPL